MRRAFGARPALGPLPLRRFAAPAGDDRTERFTPPHFLPQNPSIIARIIAICASCISRPASIIFL